MAMLGALVFSSFAQADPKSALVGVYGNKPLAFVGSRGPEGLFIEVLEECAAEQGWSLEYRVDTWDSLYRQVQAGLIDLLPVVAFSEERASSLAFSKETLVSNWGEVYTAKSLSIQSIDDLRDRNIAFLQGDTHGSYFRTLLEKLGIGHSELIVADYGAMADALETGEADAGVFNHIYATVSLADRSVRVTPIVFNPIQIRFAAKKGDPSGLLPAIDARIREMKRGDSAEYRAALGRWLGMYADTGGPPWLLYVSLASVAAILAGIALNMWLGNLVKRKTRELEESNRALLESEANHAAILRSAMDGFMLLDMDGRIVEVNEAFCAMGGYSEAELTGTAISALELAEAEDGAVERIGRLLERGEDRFESKFKKKTGEPFDVEVSVQYRPGVEKRLVAFVRDITDRKRADDIRAFMARTSSQLDDTTFFEDVARYLGVSMGMAYVCIDSLEGDGLYASTLAVWREGRFERNVTYELENTPCGRAVGKTLYWLPEGARRLFPEAKLLQRLEAESYVGATLWSHDGKPIGLIAMIGAKPAKDRDFVESTLALVGMRVSAEMERLDAERALKEREAYQHAIIECSPLPMFSMDLDGRIIAWNPAAERVFGWSAEEVRGVLLPIIPPEKIDEFFELRELLRAGHVISGIEITRMRKGGERIEVSLWSAPIFDGNGKHIGLLSYMEDITERKLAEERLRRNLEEKKVLLREVHHRVKNNLSVISSLLDLQSAKITTPEEAIGAFKNSRDRVMAMALVHKELYESGDFARIEMGAYVGSLIRQISTVFGGAGNVRYEPRADGVILNLQVAIPCGLILNELITNAYKYAYPDGRAGAIRISVLDDGAGYCRLTVADDGPGLPAGYEGGNTLGLTLVRLLVDQIDGTLEVTDSSGGSGGPGTRVSIRLPVATS